MAIVAIIDYGMGNLHSVAKALGRVSDIKVEVTSDAKLIRRADRVVLPGVGAMRDCMAEIRRLGLDEVIHDVAKTKPFLGVCVGMQALMGSSEENGGVECLGIIPGSVNVFDKALKDPLTDEALKVPHMGWNQVYQVIKHPLWQGIAQDSRFYFVHSYYAQPDNPDPVAASTAYGHPFASALAVENIFAVQFHPEKSQQAGLTLYANFVNWDGQY